MQMTWLNIFSTRSAAPLQVRGQPVKGLLSEDYHNFVTAEIKAKPLIPKRKNFVKIRFRY